MGPQKAPTDLNTFDRALRDAGAGDFDLIQLSSILPPNPAKEISRGMDLLKETPYLSLL